jgi:hypothetical protein
MMRVIRIRSGLGEFVCSSEGEEFAFRGRLDRKGIKEL